MAHGAHFGVPPVAPGGAVDPFTQQLIDAGLVDDQAQILAQQIKHGQGLMQTPGAQGMNVGGTYVAGNPLEHFSVALSRIMGGRMAHDAQQGLAKGIETKRAGRQAFAGAQAGLPRVPTAEELLAPPTQPQWSPPDILGPQTVDGVTAPPPTAAQRLAAAMDARSKLGQAGVLSGDPIVSAGGQGLLGEAKGLGQTDMAVATGNRQYGVHQQELKQKADQQAFTNTHQQGVLDETIRHNKATEGILRAKPAGGGMGGHGAFLPTDDTEAIADGILRGEIPPNLGPFRSNAAAIAASIAKKGGNLSQLQTNFGAEQKAVSSLNSAQQVRLRQTMGTLDHSLDKLEEVYAQWQKVGPDSGFKVFNRAALAAAKQGGGEAGVVAQELETLINDMVAETANVYMGGNSPTDHALKLAAANLKADWNQQTFERMVGLMRTQLRFRQNAMEATRAAGTRGENPYAPPAPEASPPAAAPSSTDALRKKYGL